MGITTKLKLNRKLEKLKEELEDLKDIREADEQFRKGEYIEIDGNKSAEEIDKILMKAKI